MVLAYRHRVGVMDLKISRKSDRKKAISIKEMVNSDASLPSNYLNFGEEDDLIRFPLPGGATPQLRNLLPPGTPLNFNLGIF